MKSILSTFLSFILLLQPTVFAYSTSTESTLFDASNRERTTVAAKVDTSFFQIPRLPEEEVKKSCKKDLKKLHWCQETFKDIENLSEGNVGLFSWCSAKFGKDFKNTPRDMCDMYEKHGVNRASAWDAYIKAKNSNETVSGYWKLSPAELYDKYEKVAKDIAILWDINPEYKANKREDISNKILVALIVTLIAYQAGIIAAPVLEGAGFPMSAQIASLLPFERGFIQVARTHFWADLGITMAYMAMDGIFLESTFNVLNGLTEELQTSIQNHVDTGYAVKTRDLLAEIATPIQESQNAEETYRLNQKLKEELKKSLKTSDWGSDPMIKREAIVTLYALEYIRAEMADMSDSFRYRQAAIDIAQIYFSDELTNLHEDRNEVYRVAEGAYNARQKIRKQKLQETADSIIRTALVD